MCQVMKPVATIQVQLQQTYQLQYAIMQFIHIIASYQGEILELWRELHTKPDPFIKNCGYQFLLVEILQQGSFFPE